MALRGLVNHKQPNSDVTGGSRKLTPERFRGHAPIAPALPPPGGRSYLRARYLIVGVVSAQLA